MPTTPKLVPCSWQSLIISRYRSSKMCRPAGMCGNSTVLSGKRGRRTDIRTSVPPRSRSTRRATARLRGLAVLGVLEDALPLGLTGIALMAERDLHADLVLTHQVVTDGAALRGEDVLLGGDSLGLLDCVGHDWAPRSW